MKQNLLALMFFGAALAASGAADAQGRPEGAGNSGGQRPPVSQQRDTQPMREQAEMRRKEAEAGRAEAEAKARSEAARAEHPPNEHATVEASEAADNARGGNETASEIRNRRDERKAIQEEYRGSRDPGQEGAGPDADSDAVAAGRQQKAKKPWWKFWGD